MSSALTAGNVLCLSSVYAVLSSSCRSCCFGRYRVGPCAPMSLVVKYKEQLLTWVS